MKQVLVLSTATLLSAAGNRDFIHVYNNGAETIFIGYDGFSLGRPDVVGVAAGSHVTDSVGNNVDANSSSDAIRNSIVPGMEVIHPAVPAGTFVISINSSGVVTFNKTVTFLAPGVQIGDSITYSAKVSVNNGWPVPAGTWYGLNTDGTKKIFNKEVWAIAAVGPVDVRLQGE